MYHDRVENVDVKQNVCTLIKYQQLYSLQLQLFYTVLKHLACVFGLDLWELKR